MALEIVKNPTILAFLTKGLRIWLALGFVLIAAGALAQTIIYDCAQLDVFARQGIALYPEEREWYKHNCEEEEGNDIVWPPPPPPTPTPRPPVDTCANLPADIVVSGFNPFATQCRPVGSAGVGDAGLIAQGILSAVDVWGDANAEIRVCFRQQGKLKFLDAATAPRSVSDLAAENIDGMTCGRINRAGTVALLQGGQTAVETIAETSDSPLPAETGPSSTTTCQLETTGYLSLRAGPTLFYTRILSMPRGTRLVARARIGDWFMVNYEGQLGWAHAGYLAVSPGCAALGEAEAIILPPMTETQAPEAEADATEMVESVGQALAGCSLRTGDIINLRQGPGLEYGVLAEIPFQTSLIAADRSGDWFTVEYAGMAGWVHIDYVFRSGACG